MKRVRQIVLSILVLFIIIQNVAALNIGDTENLSVGIAIGSPTWVNIDPEALSWTGMNPGDIGDNNSEDNRHYAIQIENIGSYNITHVWLNTSVPSSRPFATGQVGSYDAGNMVVISKLNENLFYFPNRLEFNETRDLSYVTDPEGNIPVDTTKYKYGRFRNTTKEYFWIVNSSGECNVTGTEFYIGGTPHTRQDTGSVNFNGCSGTLTNPGSGCGAGTLTQDPNHPKWGYADISIHGSQYTAAVYYTCDRVMFSHWNKDAPGAEAGSYAQYFYSGFLPPGDSIAAKIKVYLPYGIPHGTLNQGTLTVLVNDI